MKNDKQTVTIKKIRQLSRGRYEVSFQGKTKPIEIDSKRAKSLKEGMQVTLKKNKTIIV